MSPTLIWLGAGAILCLTELFFPSAFVAFMMGLAALVVAAISLVVPSLGLQVALWLVFSTVLIFLFRRFAPSKRLAKRMDAVEGKTITEILPGQTGRVMYEGNSWRAKCDDQHISIPPHEKVYVVRMEGTTLVVLSERFLHD